MPSHFKDAFLKMDLLQQKIVDTAASFQDTVQSFYADLSVYGCRGGGRALYSHRHKSFFEHVSLELDNSTQLRSATLSYVQLPLAPLRTSFLRDVLATAGKDQLKDFWQQPEESQTILNKLLKDKSLNAETLEREVEQFVDSPDKPTAVQIANKNDYTKMIVDTEFDLNNTIPGKVLKQVMLVRLWPRAKATDAQVAEALARRALVTVDGETGSFPKGWPQEETLLCNVPPRNACDRGKKVGDPCGNSSVANIASYFSGLHMFAGSSDGECVRKLRCFSDKELHQGRLRTVGDCTIGKRVGEKCVVTKNRIARVSAETSNEFMGVCDEWKLA